MKLDWSTCQCCGEPAKQRLIYRKDPNWPVPSKLYPELCDDCHSDITSHFSGNAVYEEIKRREVWFNKNFVIVGFQPIIEARAEALSYSI